MIGYVQVDGAPGESHDAGHKDWIKLLSVSESVTRPVMSKGTTTATDRATLGDVVITKLTDKSSPKLYEFTTTGKSINKITIDLVTSIGAGTETTFLKITLENVIVSSFHLEGVDEGHHLPKERVALNFRKIKIEYWPHDKAGTKGGVVETSWDTGENKKAG